MPIPSRFLAALSLLTAAAATAAPPADLDAQVERILRTFGAPGMSVAVVEGDKTVVARGYGVRKLGGTARNDARTIFPIGSCSKAFTAAALALLVDEGKLAWDDRVIDRLPGFRMYDPYTTSELTVLDLLVHRSGLGLGAGDLLFYPPTTYTRKELVQRLRHIKPATSFRSAYAYDNVLYIVAGELIEAVSGLSWEAFVKQRLFAPLGMKDATPWEREALKARNRGHLHARVDGPLRGMGPIKPLPDDAAYLVSANSAPAGSIYASATDMAQWMKALLAGGALPDGRRLFSEKAAKDLWTPHVIQPIGGLPAVLDALRPNLRAYALGWDVTDFRGHRLITHTGGVEGGVAVVGLLPDQNVAIAAMVNSEDGAARRAIFYQLLDHYLGVKSTDWVDAWKQALDQIQAAGLEALKKQPTEPGTGPGPSLPLAKYAGTYRDAWYGTVTITGGAGGLQIRFDRTPRMRGALEHVRHDTFRTRWADRTIEDAYVTFALNPDGSIERARLKAISPLADFSFDYHDLLLVPVTP